MMNPVKEILDAIQSEAEFENAEVEAAVVKALELLNKDLIFVQYEPSTDVEVAVNDMNNIIAAANSDIIEDDDDDDDDDIDLILEDDDDEDDDDLIDLTPESDPEEEEANDKPASSP